MSRTTNRGNKDPRLHSSQPLPVSNQNRPAWAYSLLEEQYSTLDLDNLELPLPQRTSRRNSNPGNNQSPSIHTNNQQPNNEITQTSTTSMDTTVPGTAVTTTSANSPITTVTTLSGNSLIINPFANVLSNMPSYKDDLIQQLLGQQVGRPPPLKVTLTLRWAHNVC